MVNSFFKFKSLVFFLVFSSFAFSITYSEAQVTVSGANTGNGTYSTLGAAFTAIGTSQSGANITISITGNTTETTTAILGAGNWNSVTISPSGGAARTITGAIAGNAIIRLNGSDNVTINGLNSGGNALTIQNTSTTNTAQTSTILLNEDATGNTIQNCTVLGAPQNSTSGVIRFLTTANVPNANSNNTITGCNIGPSNNSSANIHCILGAGSFNNTLSSNTITSNNIYGFSTYGINLGTGTGLNWTISDNHFYKPSTYTFATSAQAAILINASSSAGVFTISGNYIGGTSANGGTANTPWNLGTGAGNGFSGIRVDGMATTAGTTNIIANKIQNFTTAATQGTPFIGIDIGSGNINIGDGTDANRNIIGSTDPGFGVSVTGTSANLVAGIQVSASSSYAVEINNNIIANIRHTGGGTTNQQVYGVQYTSTCKPVIKNCKIYNLSNSCNYTTNSNPILAGIYTTATAAASGTITGNEIYNLTTSGTSVTEPLYGISMTGSSTNAVPAVGMVSGNFIHNIKHGTSNTATALIAGINVAGGSATYSNNIIQLGIDTSGNSITTGYAIYGIRYPGGTSNGNRFYHNSVYIGGTGVASAANTFAFYRGAQPLNTTPVDTVLNNIFYNNRQNSSGSANNYAVANNGVATRIVSNYNDIYGVTNLASTVSGSGTATNFAGWQGAMGEANSINSDPLFTTPGGKTPDFHLSTGTPCDAAGLAIGMITTDFYGTSRSASTPTDLGAVVALSCSTPPTPTVSVTNNCGSSILSTTETGALLWSTGATTSAITVTAAGTYSVTQTVSSCQSAAGTGTAAPLTMPSPPGVTVVNNCDGTSTLSTAATGSLLWSTGATTSSIVVSAAGTYSVNATAGGCTSADGVGTAAPKTAPDAPSVTVTDNCGSSTLSTAATGSLLWSTGATTSSIIVTIGGTYAVAQTVNGCESAPGSGVAAPIAAPSAPTAGSNSPVCTGASINLTASNISGATYSWSGPAGFASTDQNPTRSPATTGMSGTYSVTATVNGCTGSLATTEVTVSDCGFNLTVNMFLQGFYLGSGKMSPLLHLIGVSADANAVDTVTVELRNASNPNTVEGSYTGILGSSGSIGCTFDAVLTDTYYIVVKHRNSLETWSASAQQANTIGSYSFTSGAGQAYGSGNRMANLDGVYCIYSGDVDGSGSITSADLSAVKSVASEFRIGVYDLKDVTGDGFVDEDDVRILNNNISLSISLQRP